MFAVGKFTVGKTMAVASIAVIYSGHWAGLGQASGTGRWWKAPVWWIWGSGMGSACAPRHGGARLRCELAYGRRTRPSVFRVVPAAKLSVQTRSSLSKLRPRAQTGTSSQTSRESQSVADGQRCYPPNAVRWVGEVTSRKANKSTRCKLPYTQASRRGSGREHRAHKDSDSCWG